MPVTRLIGVKRDPVDAEPVPYVVEIYIAGMHDTGMHRNRAVHLMALVIVAVKGRAAGAVNAV